MLCGIYILKFTGTNKVYVGQSVDINRRFAVHLRKLKNGSANYKLQAAYETLGTPVLEVLCECDRSELNATEEEAFEIYDSINNGYNIATKPDIHLEGPENGGAKYTKNEIEEVFELLLDVNNRYIDIHYITGVSVATIRHISNGESHSWLKNAYPDKYATLEDLKGLKRQSAGNSAQSRGIVYPPIISPEGKEYIVTHIANFAKEHGLDPSSLSKVLKRRPSYASHKGWHLPIK